MEKIAAIIVTYNRLDLLKRCLDGVCHQTFSPSHIFIVDNASTDGTYEFLKTFNSHINTEIISLKKNIGGAGGFYEGLKAAFKNDHFDAFWLMDDDGVPDEDCLFVLKELLKEHAYICPLVVDIDNHSDLAFVKLSTQRVSDLKEKVGNRGILEGVSTPFNGILLRRDLVDKIGFPKSEMFIWGDEVEYDLRSRRNGFEPITAINAVHFHPKDRLISKNSILRKGVIVDVESELRNYCKYRNTAYSFKKYKGWLKTLGLYLSYCGYFLFQDHFNINKLIFFHNAFRDGLNEDFTKHIKYLK